LPSRCRRPRASILAAAAAALALLPMVVRGDGWVPVRVPGPWEEAAWQTARDDSTAMNGIGWYRGFVDVPFAWRGLDLDLHLGTPAEPVQVKVNGVPVEPADAIPAPPRTPPAVGAPYPRVRGC